MHLIDHATAASGTFVEKEGSTERTVATGDWLNALQDEFVHVIEEGGGLTLSRTSTTQLKSAISVIGAIDLKDLLEWQLDDLPAPAAVSVGDGVVVGDIFVEAVTAAAAQGDPFNGTFIGGVSLPKNNTQAMIAGQLLYWDPVSEQVDRNATDGFRAIGQCINDKLAADTTVDVRLDGQARPAVEVVAGFATESTNPSLNAGFHLQYYASDAGTITLTVERVGDSPLTEVDVSFEVDAGSTAISGTHYENLTASPVTIPSGQPSVSITFDLIDDAKFRDEVLLQLNLTAISSGSISSEADTFEAYIHSDNAVPAAQFDDAGPLSHDEDAGALVLDLNLSTASGSETRVHIKPNASSTAIEGTHYTRQASPVVVPAGTTAFTYTITPINGSLPSDLALVLDIAHETVQTKRNLIVNTDLLVPSEALLEDKLRPGQPTRWAPGCVNVGGGGYTLDPERDPSVDYPDGSSDATLWNPNDTVAGLGCLKQTFNAGEYCGAPTGLPEAAEGAKAVHWGFVHQPSPTDRRFEFFQISVMDRSRQVENGTGAAGAIFRWGAYGDPPTLDSVVNGGEGLILDDTMEFADGHADYLGNGWFPLGCRYTVDALGIGNHRLTWFFHPVPPTKGDIVDDVDKGNLWWRPQFEIAPAGDTATLPNQEVVGQFWVPLGNVIAGAQNALTINLIDV